MTGVVQTTPVVKVRGKKKTVSFILKAEEKIQVFLFNPGDIPAYGDSVRLYGKFEKPKSAKNPGEFDYANYLSQKGITLIQRVYGSHSVKVIRPSELPRAVLILEKIRSQLERRIEELFDLSHVFKALILGKRQGITSDLRQVFIKTGTAHLLAISGLHIALVAGSIYFLCLLLRFSQKRAAIISLVMTLFQVLISGAGIPVVRAGSMACLAFVAVILKREVKPLNLFFLAVFLLLLMDPKSLWSVSFQLSFLSVFSLMIFGLWKIQWCWADCFRTSFTVLVGTLPVVLYYFNVFSPMGLVANVFAIPLFHLALLSAFMTLALDIIPFVAEILARLPDFFLWLGIKWIQLLSVPRWGYFFFQSPKLWQIVGYYLFLGFTFWSHLKKKTRLSLLFFCCFIFCFLSILVPQKFPEFELTLFSVGQNEAAVLRIEKSTWLINAGREFPSDQADWTINPYLRSQGIQRLQGVLLMDEKRKHVGGLETIARDFEIEDIVYLDPEKRRVVEIGHKGKYFVFLPELGEEVLEAVRKIEYRVDVLILPATSKSKEVFIKPLIKILNPGIVAISGKKPESLKLPILDTKTHGAITFKIDPELRVFSYLEGGIFDETLTRTLSHPEGNDEIYEKRNPSPFGRGAGVRGK